jgi:hypothetical protein
MFASGKLSAGAKRIDFGQANLRLSEFLLFSPELILTVGRVLDRQTQKLDHRDHALPCARIDYLDVSFGHRLRGTMNSHRRGDDDTGATRSAGQSPLGYSTTRTSGYLAWRSSSPDSRTMRS